MGSVEVTMAHEKSTKRTEKYNELVNPGAEPLIGSQYLKKTVFNGGQRPDQIKVTVDWE